MHMVLKTGAEKGVSVWRRFLEHVSLVYGM